MPVQHSVARAIRIAHITTVDASLKFLLFNQLRSLQDAGYEITGISAPGPYVDELTGAGIRHIAVPMTRSFDLVSDLLSLWHLYRVLKREKFTIVHLHTPKPGMFGQIAASLAGTPIVVYTLRSFFYHHAPQSLRPLFVAIERLVGRRADAVLSQNGEDVSTAAEHKLYRRSSVEYLGNGIDIERFNPACITSRTTEELRNELSIPADALVIGFVGRLVREKGIPELLEAARTVLEQVPNAYFLFIGRVDSDKADVVTPELANSLGVADHCVFTDMREDIPELMSLMDLFVLPSHREGFPRSPMEAAAMGLPVIVTDIRGCREVVEHNQNGLLVPVRDAPALANAMLELIRDPEKARQMGAAGRRMAVERFDERLVFERVKATYARLLEQKGLAAPTRHV